MKKSNVKKIKYLSPYTTIVAIACVLLSVFLLFGNISLNELTLESGRNENTIKTLDSENEVLALKIEEKNSLDNIEEIATEQLGMVKLESYQIHTVNLAGDDSVEIIAEEKKDGFFDGIVASFNILLEYLN